MTFRVLPAMFILSCAIAVAAMNLRSGPESKAAEYAPPALPSRTSSPPPAIEEPPALPAAAATLSPLAFRVTTTWRGTDGTSGQAVLQVTRSVDTMRLVLMGTQKEWHFERNPADPRRVSGYLVDHGGRLILAHQESDLRNTEQLRGWADVVTMRFDPSSLRTLHRTGEETVVAGATFQRYVARDRAGNGVLDVVWSDALLLPLRWSVRQRGVTTTSTVDGIEHLAAPAGPRDPRARFPEYKVLDVSDFREHRD